MPVATAQITAEVFIALMLVSRAPKRTGARVARLASLFPRHPDSGHRSPASPGVEAALEMRLLAHPMTTDPEDANRERPNLALVKLTRDGVYALEEAKADALRDCDSRIARHKRPLRDGTHNADEVARLEVLRKFIETGKEQPASAARLRREAREAEGYESDMGREPGPDIDETDEDLEDDVTKADRAARARPEPSPARRGTPAGKPASRAKAPAPAARRTPQKPATTARVDPDAE